MVYKRIRDLREDKDMTQTQISQILHCSQRIYSNYERGDVDIHFICYLFVSPPQSIAKPSPGWNKVALLTAVRNSPCSCPFSVSLHPPPAALNSEPQRGSLLGSI